VDLTDSHQVTDVFLTLQPKYVVHLAGLRNREIDEKNYRDTYNKNVAMSLNIIDACRKLKNIRRLIFFGSCEEYGLAPLPYEETQRCAPTGPYGLSKLAVTQYLFALFCKDHFPFVVLRPSVIYGPGQDLNMFIPSLIETLIKSKPFAMTNGEQLRDFIYIKDVVDAIVKALRCNKRIDGNVINIAAGKQIMVKEIAALVEKLIGAGEYSFLNFGAIPYRQNEIMGYSVKNDRAKELLKWFPETPIDAGLQQTIKYYKDRIQHRHLVT
jgi:nucleoside-diphosphate-sugar epimerase